MEKVAVFNSRIAGELVRKGFRVVDIRENFKTKDDKVVVYFARGESLIDVLKQDYQINIRGKKQYESKHRTSIR